MNSGCLLAFGLMARMDTCEFLAHVSCQLTSWFLLLCEVDLRACPVSGGLSCLLPRFFQPPFFHIPTPPFLSVCCFTVIKDKSHYPNCAPNCLRCCRFQNSPSGGGALLWQQKLLMHNSTNNPEMHQNPNRSHQKALDVKRCF